MTAYKTRPVFSQHLVSHFSFSDQKRSALWRRRLALVIAAALSGSLWWGAGLAQAQQGNYPAVIEAPGVGGEARIDVLGERFVRLPAVANNQSRIVVYRLPDNRAGATSVFVNDRYHASLVPGAWSQLCYSTGPAEISARQMEAATRPAKDRYDTISAINLQPGQVHYLRVSDANNRPVLHPVPAAQALQEIANTRLQLHTVSRVAQDCVEGFVAQTYTLPADTLFAFDRSDRAGMTDAGTRAIDLLLSRMQNDYSRIDRVHLIGHADPLGRPERNERLAIERANTVRDYITQTGQLRVPLTAEGRSSREPVVRHCGPTATPQAIACNQPNRRVAVEVTGQRR